MLKFQWVNPLSKVRLTEPPLGQPSGSQAALKLRWGNTFTPTALDPAVQASRGLGMGVSGQGFQEEQNCMWPDPVLILCTWHYYICTPSEGLAQLHLRLSSQQVSKKHIIRTNTISTLSSLIMPSQSMDSKQMLWLSFLVRWKLQGYYTSKGFKLRCHKHCMMAEHFLKKLFTSENLRHQKEQKWGVPTQLGVFRAGIWSL